LDSEEKSSMEIGWFVRCVHGSQILTSVLSYLHISNNVYVRILYIAQNGLSRKVEKNETFKWLGKFFEAPI
jgi:hypothetical protein